MTMKIQATEVQTSTGRIVKAWNVVDADGYIFDTFDMKREAKAWIDARQPSDAQLMAALPPRGK